MNNVLNQTQGFETSDKYKAITTQAVLDRLTGQGFEVTKTLITKPRKADKEGYQKHMIRLAHKDMPLIGMGDARPELVVINSHDATTSIKFLIGVFRMVCSNGLIVGSTFNGTSIRHTGDVWTKIDDGLKDVTTSIPRIAASIQQFQGTPLTETQQLDFAKAASKLVVPETATHVNINRALVARRLADQATDLWTVYNRLQESALRGGIPYVVTEIKDGQVIQRQNTTRAIKSIDRQVSVNQSLWDLALEYAKAA